MHVPGFVMYHNPSKHGGHRGGVILLVKCNVMKYVTNVNLDVDGHIWINLLCYPTIHFGGVYLLPVDSPYYDPLTVW